MARIVVTGGTRYIGSQTLRALHGVGYEVVVYDDPSKEPTNAYGRSKLMVEELLDWFHRSYGPRSISLRYFNAAGADPSGAIGEAHSPETHLIPLILQVALGQRTEILVLGDDYETPDGTCVRDYIHVADLASAHVAALRALENELGRDAFNLGNGVGFSVREVIEAARQVTGHPIPAVIRPRRPGDPARLVASSEKARRLPDWQPEMTDIRAILETAWNWHRTHPAGYS